MILYTPEKFDANEIFVLLTTVVFWIIMLKVNRRLSRLNLALLWTLNVFLAFVADYTLGTEPLNLYKTNDYSNYEIIDLIQYVMCYPPFAYIAMNYYIVHELKWVQKILFVLICALLVTALEWVGTVFHVYTYKGWTIYLSFVVYIILFILNIFLLWSSQRFFKLFYGRNHNESKSLFHRHRI